MSLKEAMYSKPSSLLEVRVQIGHDPMTALVDGGSQLNLLSIHKAKEHELRVASLPNLMAEALSGAEFKIYGTTEVTMRITDSRARIKEHVVPFVVAEIKHYQVCLGLPWIDAYLPKISYRSRRLLFRGEKSLARATYKKVALEDAKEFKKTL